MKLQKITKVRQALSASLLAGALSLASFVSVLVPQIAHAHSCAYPDFVAIDYSLSGNANSLYRYSYDPTNGDFGTLQDVIFDESAGYRSLHGFVVHEGVAYVSQWTGSVYEMTGYVVDPSSPDYGSSYVVANAYGVGSTLDAQNGVIFTLDGGSVDRVELDTGQVSNLISGGAQDGSFSQFGIEYGPDGRLYILNQNDAVEVYDANTGAFIEFFATGTGTGRYGQRDIAFDAAGDLYTSGNGGVHKFHGPGSSQAGAFISTMSSDQWEHGMSFHPTTGELFIAQYDYNVDLEIFDYAAGSQTAKYGLPLNGGKDVQFIECSGPAVNQAPTVSAGSDQVIYDDNPSLVLNDASVNDDNFPGNPTTTSWTVVSSPVGSSVQISDTSVVNPMATFDVLGDYILELTADDGEFSISDNVTVTLAPVPPNVAPSVMVAQPTDGQEFYNGSDIDIVIDASDSDGTVDQVEVFVNGGSHAVLNQAPYTTTLTNVQNGSYVITAIATDNDGDSASTTVTEISVVDQPPAPLGLDVYSDVTGPLESNAIVYSSGTLSEVATDPFEGAMHYDFALPYYKYQNFEIYPNAMIDTTGYNTLSFAMKGVNPTGASHSNQVTVSLTSGSYGGPTASYTVTIDGDYENFEIPLSAFSSIDLSQIYGIKFSFGSMSYNNVYFDGIRFVSL